MSNNNRLWVVIPAAGIGKRMGVDIPKQYITVCDKAIIEHTVEKFTSRNDLQGILVALSNSDQHWSTLELSENNKITTVTGGEERYKSVYNALCSLKNKAGDDDWILVHDAVRPCITTSEIDQFIADLDHLNGIGGILALPCFETMKKANTNHEIEETIEVTIAIPADGPSFGVAPSGTCIWKSFFSKTGGIIPYSKLFDLTNDLAALTLSLIHI